MGNTMFDLSQIESRALEVCRNINEALVVRVRISADDPECVCIRVFGAEGNEVGQLEELLFDLEETLFEENGPVLLPMIKTLAVTEEYYPEQFREIRAMQYARIVSIEKTKWTSVVSLKGACRGEEVAPVYVSGDGACMNVYADVIPKYKNAGGIADATGASAPQADYAMAA